MALTNTAEEVAMVARTVFGLGSLALLAMGCASGMHSVVGNEAVGGDVGQASPAFPSSTACEGWYDSVAGVCNAIGD